MKRIYLLTLFFISAQTVFAQSGGDKVIIKATPTPIPVTAASISATISKNFEKIDQKIVVSTAEREKAYISLMEGQRLYTQAVRMRSPGGLLQAKESFRKAVETDHNLAEGYTAIADVAWLSFQVVRTRGAERGSEADLEEVITASSIAVKLSPNSLRPHHLLAMAYTEKSGLGDGKTDAQFTEKAIMAWSEVGRIDTRNAEAFAFLSIFYERTFKKNEQIESLKKWLGAANPIDSRFYQQINQTRESLSPDNASLKLGKALIEAGRTEEAVEFLNRAITADPENEVAVELLKEAIMFGDFSNSAGVIQSLRQASFANPKNTALVLLLADLQIKDGKNEDALKTLLAAMEKVPADQESAAADLQVKLGEIYLESENYIEAVKAFNTALKLRKLETSIVTEEERIFVMSVYEKIVQSYQNAEQFTEAKNAIDKAKSLLGKEDIFADQLLIDFYRETGKRAEALKVIREIRSRNKDDYGFLRLEATVLTELDRVDEAVALIKPLINQKSTANFPQFDDFTNYVFISTLYNEAKRGKEAVQAANQAITAAKSEEEKQIGKIVLASAQQISGNFPAAEATLRTLLKQTPGNPMALNNLGYFLLERNVKLTEALSLIQQAIKIDPNNPSYLDSLGWAYFKLGNLEEAEKNLRNAARLMPSATILEHLGDVYQKQNKIQLAKSTWRKALNAATDKETSDRLKLKLSR